MHTKTIQKIQKSCMKTYEEDVNIYQDIENSQGQGLFFENTGATPPNLPSEATNGISKSQVRLIKVLKKLDGLRYESSKMKGRNSKGCNRYVTFGRALTILERNKKQWNNIAK